MAMLLAKLFFLLVDGPKSLLALLTCLQRRVLSLCECTVALISHELLDLQNNNQSIFPKSRRFVKLQTPHGKREKRGNMKVDKRFNK